MFRVVCGDWASEPTSLEAAQYLQAKLGEGIVEVLCPEHGWVPMGPNGCVECDYRDFIETREDARAMLYGG